MGTKRSEAPPCQNMCLEFPNPRSSQMVDLRSLDPSKLILGISQDQEVAQINFLDSNWLGSAIQDCVGIMNPRKLCQQCQSTLLGWWLNMPIAIDWHVWPGLKSYVSHQAPYKSADMAHNSEKTQTHWPPHCFLNHVSWCTGHIPHKYTDT